VIPDVLQMLNDFLNLARNHCPEPVALVAARISKQENDGTDKGRDRDVTQEAVWPQVMDSPADCTEILPHFAKHPESVVVETRERVVQLLCPMRSDEHPHEDDHDQCGPYSQDH